MKYGGVAELEMATDCKSVGTAYAGSNPASSTKIIIIQEMPRMKREPRYELFAASGSSGDEEETIVGRVEGITFVSDEFTGTMDSQKFWDDLRSFAKKKGKYIKLCYVRR